MSSHMHDRYANKENLLAKSRRSSQISIARAFGTDLTRIVYQQLTNSPLKAYKDEIYQYLYTIQSWNQASYSAIQEMQHDLTEDMRRILVNWLQKVHMVHKMRQETIYLAISLLDRMLSILPVSKKKLQLLGVTALMIAGKFEEIYPPLPNHYIILTDNAYYIEELFHMEREVLKSLNYKISGPTVLDFLSRFGSLMQYEDQNKHLTQYLAELLMQRLTYCKYQSSIIAGSCILLTNKFTKVKPEWPVSLQTDSKLGQKDLRQCAKEIIITYQQRRQDERDCLYQKFASDQFSKVSLVDWLKASRENSN